MRRVNLQYKFLAMDAVQAFLYVWWQWYKQKLPLVVFIVLCLNLVIAPVVYAAGDGNLERRSAWAIGILGFVILGLIIYLFDVIFRPERY
ncbi:potassium-transporting ATPase subunit F [Scytonema hofmannii FACHB-248]|uniref:Potassium-transporting ATPase subunit F n=1 Tax=Scytonema hofmannii FACHB-248 TaxID=1842502 RepID=A0ABR8GT39_9CYAN|nr:MULTISPECIES: potassium-transporting ATPase subunit F [Nostocales]MBD2606382.1 potassium-transporting ATPase subunit F [Scytonema hofmannii FACHB-248]